MANAQQLYDCIRSHWTIENSLHWVLDVGFNEDLCRIRNGNSAENFTILRHIAVNLLHQEKTAKIGIKNKRLRAGWDKKYLLQVLSNSNTDISV